MKRLKKFGAIICAIAMIVSSITYYPTSNVSAAKTATSLPKKVLGLDAVSKVVRIQLKMQLCLHGQEPMTQQM